MDSDFNESDPITPLPVPGLLREVGANFFNFQPYLAIKYQFLERLDYESVLGITKELLDKGWKLNGRTTISDSPQSTLEGVSFRLMGYIGL